MIELQEKPNSNLDSEHQLLLDLMLLNNDMLKNKVFKAYHRRVRNVITAHGVSIEDSHELVTTTFCKFFRSLDKIKENSSGKAIFNYLLGIAIKNCFDKYRYNRRRITCSHLDLYVGSDKEPCNLDKYNLDTQPQVLMTIKAILKRNDMFDVVRMRVFEELNFTEIGKSMNMTREQVKNLYYKAIIKIRVFYADNHREKNQHE